MNVGSTVSVHFLHAVVNYAYNRMC